jgi:putative transposase
MKGCAMKKPHAKNLRKGRVSTPNQTYLITTVTQERSPCFQDFYLGRIVINALRYQHDNRHVNSHAFVLMPNHLHWLLSLSGHRSLSDVIKQTKSFSSMQLGKTNPQLKGGIWQPGFHDHALRKDEELAAVARYIINNPVRAGIVVHIGDYPLWDAEWL